MNLSKKKSRSQLSAKEDISNIHFYDNRQKTKKFQFITPNLEFIYYLCLLIIKMESYKEEKIVLWSGKMLFSNHLWEDEYHLLQMNSKKVFFGCIGNEEPVTRTRKLQL
jgi:hypothetical protein